MITDDLLAALRYKGEGNDLDFKSDRYAFEGATEEQKSELLKDILAFANAFRDGAAYILMGFKEDSPHPAKVCGLPMSGSIDDSRLQQFVSGKLDRPLELRYEERMFDGKHIAVIEIPKQQRPFSSAKDFGKVRKNLVYVRRGSATDIANPQEIAAMVKADAFNSAPSVSLLVTGEDNAPLQRSFVRTFLTFPNPLPDYERARGAFDIGAGLENRSYWRDLGEYHSQARRAIAVRLALSNESTFSLGNAKLEVTCTVSPSACVKMIRADDAVNLPRSTDWPHFASARSVHEIANSRMEVDDIGLIPIANIRLGTLRPRETVRAEDDLMLLPSGPGTYTLTIRVLADELSTPVVQEQAIEVSGECLALDSTGFAQLLKSERKGTPR